LPTINRKSRSIIDRASRERVPGCCLCFVFRSRKESDQFQRNFFSRRRCSRHRNTSRNTSSGVWAFKGREQKKWFEGSIACQSITQENCSDRRADRNRVDEPDGTRLQRRASEWQPGLVSAWAPCCPGCRSARQQPLFFVYTSRDSRCETRSLYATA
ncbi:unnamed protein product, partial [Pylaiella littoralis]